MAGKSEPIPGTSDILPAETPAWRFIEEAAHKVFTAYGYGELRTPIFERTRVFLKSIGDETDIVQKEMYTFEDRGGRSLTLRPEGTAGVMRALGNIGIPQGEEHRVYYCGPMFRGERPAAGRKRQFHQIGVEAAGKCSPQSDVECIAMLVDYLDAIGLKDTRLQVNSRGVKQDRKTVSKELRAFFSDKIDGMCEDCQRRLDTNVWRILDCKEEACGAIVEQAPLITDLLCDDSKQFFNDVCHGLDTLGIAYEHNPRMVRGLDYYEHTVWEIIYEGIGAQNSIAGGGRYQIQPPGMKKPIPGVGFAAGIERMLLTLEDQGGLPTAPDQIDAYLVSLGPKAMDICLKLARQFRLDGQTVMMDLEGRGMRAQLRTANKLNARRTYILGEDELARNVIVCKDMESSEQKEIAIDDLLQ